MITKFPDPRSADPETGILASGGDLEPESLLLAYRQGIFPWPMKGFPLLWFCPTRRGILFFKKLHFPRSLEKFRRKSSYTFTTDKAFGEVIRHCAKAPRPGERGTWITQPMIQAYTRLHELGYAHSIETWAGDKLVGGIYGVSVDGIFAGESMFHLKPNASKLALLHLVDLLTHEGVKWMDIQMVTPHMAILGAEEISRDDYLKLLGKTLRPRKMLLSL